MSIETATFAQIVAQTVADGRELAESLMVDTCTITRAGEGAPVFNETTGQYTDPARLTVYTGKCRIQVTSIIANSTSSNAGDRAYAVQGSELQLPVDGTGDVSVNDVAEITAAELDDELVTRKFTVTARHEKSQATSRRLRVTEVTA